jgi:hypothetical protein
MNIPNEFSKSDQKGKIMPAVALRLTGIWQKTGIIVWGVITLVSLLFFAVSLYSLNLWDRVPADQASRYFTDLTAKDVQAHADYQVVVLQAGYSLAGYASIFTVVRFLGGLALFAVGFLLIYRHNDSLMAVLMAILLSVFAAAGIWANPLFSWAVAIAPWMHIPASFLGWALWCGLVVLYIFPDGRYTPRWTLWLSVAVIPLTFLMAFSINIFLNPDNWPDPFTLLPNIIFIGAGFFAILYRYWHKTSTDEKQRLRGYVLGLSLLMVAYYANFFINEIYYRLAGHPLLQGYRADMNYVLVFEPLWYALQVCFAIGLAVSVFRNRLLED